MRLPTKILPPLLLVLAMLLCLLLYWPGLDGPLVFDSAAKLSILSYLKNPDTSLWWVMERGYPTGFIGRPLSMLSFIGNYYLSNDINIWAMKFTNLLLHCLTGAAVYLLVKRLLQLASYGPVQAGWMALAVSALWLLSPLQVSTTLYVIQRMAQLATLLSLLSLYAYLSFRTRIQQQRPYALALLLTLALWLAAILCKENGLLVPLYVVLIEVILLNGSGWRFAGNIKAIRYSLLALMVLAGIVLLPVAAQLFDYSTRDFSLAERLLTECRVIFDYLQQLLLPAHIEFGLYQDDYRLSRSLFDDTLPVIPLLLLSATVLLCVLPVHPPSAAIRFGLSFFLAAHVMESTLVPLELYFEHRNYLPAVGLYMALVCALMKLTDRGVSPRLPGLLLLVYIAYFSAMTGFRSQLWSDQRALIESALRYHPQSIRAKSDYAQLLLIDGKFTENIRLMDEIIALEKENKAASHIQKFYSYCLFNKKLPSPALEQFERDLSPQRMFETSNALKNYLQLYKKNRCQSIDIRQFTDLLFAWMDRLEADGELDFNASWATRQQAYELLYYSDYAATMDARLQNELQRGNIYAGFYLIDLQLERHNKAAALTTLASVTAHMPGQAAERDIALLSEYRQKCAAAPD